MAQQSIEIESLSHLGPLPVASKVGPLVESSIINPFDPGTRDVPETFEAQAENLFIHIGQALQAAGGGWDDLAKVTFFVADPSEARALLNVPWLERYPDPSERPARHTMKIDMGDTVKVSCVFTAYITG